MNSRKNTESIVKPFSEEDDPLTYKVIGAAIQVHRTLGPGLLESVYEECLSYELAKRSITFERQKTVSIQYGDITLDCGFRVDILVDNQLIVELMAVDELIPVHTAQVLTYMKLTGCQKGLLINFNVKTLIEGVKRFVL